jgi:hypothetical protein
MTQAAVLASNASLMTTPSGTAPGYMARAWVNFNGTGTVAIRASGNVSSITDNGVGDYTVNFTTAMSDANYAISGTISPKYAADSAAMTVNTVGTAAGVTESAPTTSSFRFMTVSPGPAALDPKYVNVSIFR